MDQVASLLNRPKLYNNIDGMQELGGGCGAVGFGLLLWLQAHAPKGSVWHGYAAFIYMGAMVAIIHYVTKAIKTRCTYPRTGFVEYRKRDKVWPTIAAVILGPAALMGLFIARRSHWDVSALGSLFGLGFAASYGYHLARAVRWKWVVAGAMALGSTATAFLPPRLLAAVASDSWSAHPVRTKLVGTFLISMAVCGVLLLISGAISFRRYLRHTQAAQDAQ